MNKQLRVMHIAWSLDAGGVEELLHITAKFNLKQNYELAFVACDSKDGAISRKIQGLGYEVFGLNISGRAYDLRMVPRLLKIFRKFRPDIVHLYSKVNLLGRIVSNAAEIPIVICNEVDLLGKNHGLLLRGIMLAKKNLDFLADRIVTCSESVRRHWEGKKSKKYIVMYLPIDMEKPKRVHWHTNGRSFREGEFPVIGLVSRICPNKGHEFLIRALPLIINQYPRMKLKLVGKGPLVENLKMLAAQLNLTDYIEFTGYVDDIYSQLCSMDIFVLPSLSEGLPLSLMEAMALGIPAVATKVGGIPEIIEDGVTGFLVKPKDPGEIAQAVIKILFDYEKAVNIGQQGRQKIINDYNPCKYIHSLDSLYRELIEEKQSSYNINIRNPFLS